MLQGELPSREKKLKLPTLGYEKLIKNFVMF